MKLRLLLVVSIVLAFGVAVSAALAGEGSQPSPRKLCTKGHWQQWPVPTGGQFKNENKCVNFLQSVQQDCRSVEGKFGADNQTSASFDKVLWTCNGDGLTLEFVLNVLVPDCGAFGNIIVFAPNGTQGVPAMTCFLT